MHNPSPLLGFWVQLKLCMWSSRPLLWLTSQVRARPARFGMWSMSDATTMSSCHSPCICPSSFNLNPCLQAATLPPLQLLRRSTERYQTRSQSFHSHLAHFSCLNQGWAVIRNSTKPASGIKAVFNDDDHSSQKIKYLVPIYNHSY